MLVGPLCSKCLLDPHPRFPRGPHKETGAVERFHIAEPKGSTSVRDRSMSRRLVPAASKSTYALCSGSLIRKIELGWGSTM